MSGVIGSKEAAVERIRHLLTGAKNRTIIGIVGKPGAGKSTLSQFIVDQLRDQPITVVPMDGYHLSNEVLKNLSRSDRKGAPDTFDVQGFTSLLERIQSEKEDIYFPIFDRSIEESIAAQGVVRAETKIVIVEGNYLLHQQDGWQSVAQHCDEIWFIDIDDEIRLQRLIARHVAYGKSSEEAEKWSRGSDEANARLIAEGKSLADFVIFCD